MANGKGALDCHNCVWHRFSRETEGKWGKIRLPFCMHYKIPLPRPGTENIICHFYSPTEKFAEQCIKPFTRDERMGHFGCELEPGILYTYFYNSPPDINPLMNLEIDKS